MPLSIRYVTRNEAVHGFRYLWAKTVRGFDPAVHCARCLVGPYQKAVGLRMRVNVPIALDAAPGEVVYLCGVANPYRWERNLHLAVRVVEDPESVARVEAWNGDAIEIAGARAIPFDGAAAAEAYGDRGRAFLTCRNFQFGAATFAAEEIPG